MDDSKEKDETEDEPLEPQETPGTPKPQETPGTQSTQNPGGWSEKKIKVIKLVENRAAAKTWMHENAKKYYNWLNKLSMVGLGLCDVVASSNILPVILPNLYASPGSIIPAVIALVVLVILFGLLTAIFGALGFGDSVAKHSELSKSNSLLHIKCSEMLARQPSDRTNPDKFIHSLLKDEYLIQADTATIPKYVLRKYYRVFKLLALPHEIIFHQVTWNVDDLQNELNLITDTTPFYEGAAPKQYPWYRRILCCKKQRHTLPERTASAVMNIYLEDGCIKESILTKMAKLEETISIISKKDIEAVMTNHHPSAPSLRRKHTIDPIPAETQFEIDRGNDMEHDIAHN
jgi:hypothetical protein